MSELLPVKRSKSQARRYYDRISGIYDWIASSEIIFIKKGVDLLSALPGEWILEIGTGTGTGLALIARALSGEGTLVGMDLSHRMLLASQEKTRVPNPAPYLIQGDGTHLPVQGDWFDGILCAFTLELFSAEEICTVLKDIQRVLKPSGRLVVVALAQQPHNLAVRLYELAHQLFPVAVDCRPIPLVDLLEDNGFKIRVKDTSMNWGLPVHIVLCDNA